MNTDDAVMSLAREAGLMPQWRDYQNQPREVSIGTLRSVLCALELPAQSQSDIAGSRARLAAERVGQKNIAASRCFGIGELAAARLWGLAVQVYALRQPGDCGFGDLGALRVFCRKAAAAGAQALVMSPIHALFAADSSRYSPYAPSSRLFLNPLYSDPGLISGAASAARNDGGDLIDWPEAARRKTSHLHAAWQALRAQAETGTGTHAQNFHEFCIEGGDNLRNHACFEVLHAQQLQHGAGRWHWRNWPQELRSPDTPAVRAFAQEHSGEVRYHMFLQWLTNLSLAACQKTARDSGMRIGLVADLAIGTDSGGSHSWSRPQDILNGVTIGAPPDLLNQLGQNWGLTAFSPRALRRNNFEPFAEILRSAMRHAGGLRIDHVLGLRRLWLIPEGADPADGVYLQYPEEELLAVIARESWRHRCIVIGEDLGTVPEGFRERMAAAGILGLQVLWFERDHKYFVEPSRWSPHAVAVTSTHDLPTVAGWCAGTDLDWRAHLGLFDTQAQNAQARHERGEDRAALAGALDYARLAQESSVTAAAAFVARTPCPLAIFPVEDVLGLPEQANVPGTVDEHPNWRRRLPVGVEHLLDEPQAQASIAAIRRERP